MKTITNDRTNIDPIDEYISPSYGWGIYPPYRTTYNEGWVCPKCGAVMAPNTTCCVNCTPSKQSYVITCKL